MEKKFFTVQTFNGEMWEGEYLSGEWEDLGSYRLRSEAERVMAKRTRGCDPEVVPLRWRIAEQSIEI
jgi:hypothetical protein